MDNHSMLRIPVTCPECCRESVMELTVSELAIALLADGCVRLSASCHDVSWNASVAETDQIRRYLRAHQMPPPARPWIKTPGIRAIPMSHAD